MPLSLEHVTLLCAVATMLSTQKSCSYLHKRPNKLNYHNEKLLSIALLAGLMAACSTQKPLYSWYNYEEVTYKFDKKQSEAAQQHLLEEYQKMIEKQKGLRKTVPPGLNAEYGFLLCKLGKKEEGIKYLKAEIALYPESATYVSRIIKQLEK